MNEKDIVSIHDDQTIREDQIYAMLKYTAIYDDLHNDEMSVHEALKNASLKTYIHPVTGKEHRFSLRTLYRYLNRYKTFKMNGLKRSAHKNKGRPKVIPIDLCKKIFSLKHPLPLPRPQLCVFPISDSRVLVFGLMCNPFSLPSCPNISHPFSVYNISLDTTTILTECIRKLNPSKYMELRNG